MANQYNNFSRSLPADITPYSLLATSQYLNYRSQSSTQGYNVQHAQEEPATPYHGYDQEVNIYQQNNQRDNPYQNGGYPPDTPYSPGTAFSPPQGVNQTIVPFRPQYDHNSSIGNMLYYQGPANSPHNVSRQEATPIRQSDFTLRENNNHPRFQFNPTPQGYVHYHNPLCALALAPQSSASFKNTATPIGNPIASASANSIQHEYKTPPRLLTTGPSNSYSGYVMMLSNRYPPGVHVNNGDGQMLPNTPAPRTPQSMPLGLSDGMQTATPENNYIVIKRKPAMRPKNDPIHAEDVMHGSIVWLSNHQDWHEPIICVQNHECNDKIKEIDGRNHPVTILRINQRHGSDIIGDVVLDIAIMTTLCGLSLQGYVRRLRTLGPDTSKQWYLQETMPLSWVPQQTSSLKGSKLEEVRETERLLESEHHAELNERGNTLLRLLRGTMQRRTYMRVHHVYAVPIKQLQACSRYAKLAHMVRLDEPSYRRVMESLNLVPDPWETSVERSVASAPKRLRGLRDAEVARLNAARVTDRLCLQREAADQQRLAISQLKPPTDVAAGDLKRYEEL